MCLLLHTTAWAVSHHAGPVAKRDRCLGRQDACYAREAGDSIATRFPQGPSTRWDPRRYLVQRGASLDAKTILGAALANAATAERVENARALIELGADVDGEATATPLSFASAKGNTELVSLLLHHRADPNRRLYKERTALHVAAINGRRAVVELLLEAGADRSIRDSAGRRALDEALERGDREIVALLQDPKPGQ